MQPYVAARGHATVADVVAAEIGDGSFDIETFRNGMAGEFEKGNARCVVVLDAAPTDLIELAGYLQTVTNDRLDIDLVTVMAYDVRGSQVLVPQLVEPERAVAASVSPSRIQREAKPTPGSASFRDSIDSADPSLRELRRRLCDWAERLQSDGLATLFTTVGKGRWVLNPRLPGQSRGMFTIWNDQGPYVRDPDLLRSMVKTMAETLMSTEANALCGAGPSGETRRPGQRQKSAPGVRPRFTRCWPGCSAHPPATTPVASRCALVAISACSLP
ncbi:hypothetical protein N5079_26050 [Planotetraspora sp. A-T 1434]|uniref:hypothetical protein n=1 Tax=Planotetraspora sp. A-T 1434 TaxID=2979219 RepID=UPI0021BE5C45|nr:hypothetical protein [Planotetraspora sp. A-T 1434]MCT9933682.1 hypothetical protein [Planotetraspora sp. A-T 1434]